MFSSVRKDEQGVVVSGELDSAVRNNHTLKSRSVVITEWNINDAEHIAQVGNYRYRWAKDERDSPDQSGWPHKDIEDEWDESDASNSWTDATDANIEVAGLDLEDPDNPNGNIPTLFQEEDLKFKFNYSLEQCFAQHRPRSGVNYPIYFGEGQKFAGLNSVYAPRYYMGHAENDFKYWTSYRKVDSHDGLDESDSNDLSTDEMGVSKVYNTDEYYIHDAAPFVVYDESYPTNNIVVKMQSNMGEANIEPFNREKSSLPAKWRVEKLDVDGDWVTVKSFTDESTSDDFYEVPWDGYVELNYGIIMSHTETDWTALPDDKRFLGYFDNLSLVPEYGVDGDFYVILDDENSGKGTCYAWIGDKSQATTDAPDPVWSFKKVSFQYDWYLGSANVGEVIMSDFCDSLYVDDNEDAFRDFDLMKGLRVVVDTMVAKDRTFDLIELSPRLVADITDRVTSVETEKAVGIVDTTALPIGGFQAGTGSVEILDYDMSFNSNNNDSIIHNMLDRNTSFYVYDCITVGYYNYYIPIKKLFNEFKEPEVNQYSVSYSLRDLFYKLENLDAPGISLFDVSLSYAVGTILDLVGHTNYVFKYIGMDSGNEADKEQEPTIPYFFVNPEKNVAEILEELAVATQSAMFFDEYNNFVVMYKDFLMSNRDRPLRTSTNRIAYMTGNEPQKDEWDIRKSAMKTSANNLQEIIKEDESFPDILPNIIDIASDEKKTYNQGTITYSTRHLERDVATLEDAQKMNVDQRWIYKAAMLWEVAPSDNVRSKNEVTQQSGYALSAVPLEYDLDDSVPTIVNGEVKNNTMYVGDNIFWLGHFNGYLYSAGEIIKFDAVQYKVVGMKPEYDQKEINGEDHQWIMGYKEDETETKTVWISDPADYQKYFGNTPFNGKMYPTGMIRIWTDLEYDDNDNIVGVKEHGRAQFNTDITSHTAGVSSDWTNNNNCYGYYDNFYSAFMTCDEDEDGNQDCSNIPDWSDNSNWNDSAEARKSIRRGFIQNFAREEIDSAANNAGGKKLTEINMVQASALYFGGPKIKRGTGDDPYPSSAISFIKHNLPEEGAFKHFGARVRILGDYGDAVQMPSSSDTDVPDWEYTGKVLKTASGGIAFGVNSSGEGYYLELKALGYDNPDAESDPETEAFIQQIDNVILWKKKNNIITKIAGGVLDVVVDSGDYVGMQRMQGEETATTVYDIAVEYTDNPTAGKRRFYVYVNGAEAFTVDDPIPNPIIDFGTIAPFVRGSSTLMFENMYALEQNITVTRDKGPKDRIKDTFGLRDDVIGNNDGSKYISYSDFYKYGISGFVQETYLKAIQPDDNPGYNLWYEEFGAIMREAAYFDIKYEAYPAFISRISPVLNGRPAFIHSGFQAGPYGAKFLIFNAMDAPVVLDETSGNYLRVQGVTFTQNTSKEYTMDDLLNKVAKPEYNFSKINNLKTKYSDIKKNRSKYGKVDWSLDNTFIQSDDAAKDLMEWLIDKTTRPRQMVGLKIFHNPLIQLGDRVKVSYSRNSRDWADPDDTSQEVDVVCDAEKLFVVYNIKYSRGNGDVSMEIYLSEV